jgi:hypothetical protein
MSVEVSARESAPRGLIGTGAGVEGSAPVLISEQAVMLATAATPREQREERRMPRSYPRRCGYLEDAAMCREMHRL